MRGRLWVGTVVPIAVLGCRANFDVVPDAAHDAPVDAIHQTLAGCELWLKMDELKWQGTAGDVADSCGQDDPGLAIGGISTEVDPVRGRVGTFSGVGYVSVADSSRLRGGTGRTTLTLTAWVRALAPVGQPPAGVIAKRTSFGLKSAYTMFLWTGGHMWSDIVSEDDRVDVPTLVVADRWTHLAVVYDGGEPKPRRIRTYQDGVRTGEWPESSTQIPPDYDASVTIGYLPDMEDPNLHFRGRLDDVTIWSRALTDQEIADWHDFTKR